MGRQEPINADRRRLVEGLTEHERIARLEQLAFGDKSKPGLEWRMSMMRQHLEELESREASRELLRAQPWYVRWFFTAKQRARVLWWQRQRKARE